MQNRKTILLLTPSKTAKGGIVNYFNVLEGNFNIPVEYFIRGARNWPHRSSLISELLRAWDDLQGLKKRIKIGDIGLLQSSTSLGSFSVIRDGLFLNAANKRGIITIAFFRGWDENYENKLKGIKLLLFKKYYFSCNALIVLSEKFEKKLMKWGYQGSIFIETTIVDEELIKDFDLSDFEKKLKGIDFSKANLLFLARTEKAKGLYEAIDAFSILKKQHSKLKFIIAGDGFELSKAKEYVNQLGLKSEVDFTGFVSGKKKAEVYEKANLYIFPSYSEGMPNSVLEAMAFGLPVITTAVGGLTDFFENGKNGYFVDIKDSDEISNKANQLLNDPDKYKDIAIKNFEYARSRFTTSEVIKRLENIYLAYL